MNNAAVTFTAEDLGKFESVSVDQIGFSVFNCLIAKLRFLLSFQLSF